MSVAKDPKLQSVNPDAINDIVDRIAKQTTPRPKITGAKVDAKGKVKSLKKADPAALKKAMKLIDDLAKKNGFSKSQSATLSDAFKAILEEHPKIGESQQAIREVNLCLVNSMKKVSKVKPTVASLVETCGTVAKKSGKSSKN